MIPLTEDQFAGRVHEYAKLRQWRCVHARPALTKKGWRTAFTGDEGAPDWLFARRGVVLLVEFKSEDGELGPGQPEWGLAIGPEHYRLWRPSDWDQIQEELR
jgi:hypothetical protein